MLATTTRPNADFITGNPPFTGAGPMRLTLGDGYVEALRGAWPEVPERADFVMFWRAPCGTARRFGFITTNSLRQTFNGRVVEAHLHSVVKSGEPAQPALRLAFAVPDHPWVGNIDGAAVHRHHRRRPRQWRQRRAGQPANRHHRIRRRRR